MHGCHETLRRALREWTYADADRIRSWGPGTEVDAAACFPEWLRWVLALWTPGEGTSPTETSLVLALDPTHQRDEWVALAVSVVYREPAIPVAWHVEKADAPESWTAHDRRLLGLLAPAVPSGMPVHVPLHPAGRGPVGSVMEPLPQVRAGRVPAQPQTLQNAQDRVLAAAAGQERSAHPQGQALGLARTQVGQMPLDVVVQGIEWGRKKHGTGACLVCGNKHRLPAHHAFSAFLTWVSEPNPLYLPLSGPTAPARIASGCPLPHRRWRCRTRPPTPPMPTGKPASPPNSSRKYPCQPLVPAPLQPRAERH